MVIFGVGLILKCKMNIEKEAPGVGEAREATRREKKMGIINKNEEIINKSGEIINNGRKTGITPKPGESSGSGKLTLRMTNGYGVATDYRVKNECPVCKGKFVDIRTVQQCCDGEHTHVHNFACEKNCLLTYKRVIEYNGYVR